MKGPNKNIMIVLKVVLRLNYNREFLKIFGSMGGSELAVDRKKKKDGYAVLLLQMIS